MKKLLIIAAILLTTSAFAQTEKGMIYLNTQFPIGATALQNTMNPSANFATTKDVGDAFGINLNAGYFVIDDLAINAGIGFNYFSPKGETSISNLDFGVGVRYFIKSMFPVGVNYMYSKQKGDEAINAINLEAGYAWFFTEHVSFEPMVFYAIPFSSGSKSTFGIKLGLGVYF